MITLTSILLSLETPGVLLGFILFVVDFVIRNYLGIAYAQIPLQCGRSRILHHIQPNRIAANFKKFFIKKYVTYFVVNKQTNFSKEKDKQNTVNSTV